MFWNNGGSTDKFSFTKSVDDSETIWKYGNQGGISGRAAVAADFDGDGDIDIYVTL